MLTNAETVSFYLLHNVSTLNQCREVSCVTDTVSSEAVSYWTISCILHRLSWFSSVHEILQWCYFGKVPRHAIEHKHEVAWTEFFPGVWIQTVGLEWGMTAGHCGMTREERVAATRKIGERIFRPVDRIEFAVWGSSNQRTVHNTDRRDQPRKVGCDACSTNFHMHLSRVGRKAERTFQGGAT